MNIVLKDQRVGGFSPKTVHFLFLFGLLNETVSLGASAQSSANQAPASVSGLLHLASPCSSGCLCLHHFRHCLPGALCPSSHAGSERRLSKRLCPDSYALAYLVLPVLAKESVILATLHTVSAHF